MSCAKTAFSSTCSAMLLHHIDLTGFIFWWRGHSGSTDRPWTRTTGNWRKLLPSRSTSVQTYSHSTSLQHRSGTCSFPVVRLLFHLLHASCWGIGCYFLADPLISADLEIKMFTVEITTNPHLNDFLLLFYHLHPLGRYPFCSCVFYPPTHQVHDQQWIHYLSIICVPSGIAYNHHMHLADFNLKCWVSESLVSTLEYPAVGIL